nr:RNA-directed DNA polymerase, eukaryota [Tanacetum cinerariifolium]
MVDGEWVDDPIRVKEEFRTHFAMRFQAPAANRYRLDFWSPNRLSLEQAFDLESPVTNDEIRCNSSFVALIPKINDPRFVSDYRPISLIGSLYKVVTKVLATRLSLVIWDLISDVQTTFLPNRQIIDEPFIINELLSWCNHYKQQAMLFKVDFSKAYDSVRWDYLDDVLRFFGSKWFSWISGSLISGMASILVNGSLTSEFQFHCGLKQGDPLDPYLFILIMESLHLSFSRVVDAGLFKGIRIGSSLMISHLFYVDDAVFIGEGSDNNHTRIMHIFHCFSLSSGLRINILKSHLLGVSVPRDIVNNAATILGCLVMMTPFKYLGVMVGGNMSLVKAWDQVIGKLNSRLSKWKRNTLSIGGQLTLLKSILGSTLIYTMSIYKVPKLVLHSMEVIRRKFFYGIHGEDKKITWVSWSKVLAAKEYGGLGVSSYHALNRALLFKWEVQSLKSQGVDLLSHCRIRVGNGFRTRSVPTRTNLLQRNVSVPSLLYPTCSSSPEDISHLLFKCSLAVDVSRLICRWWDLSWSPLVSYSEWLD